MIRSFHFLFVASILLWSQIAQAYDYGAGQILRFSDNRKDTAVFLTEQTEYYRFLEKAFEGSYTSVPLRWDNEEPQGNAFAENTPNDERTLILIRVSSKLPPLDQIAALVYECMNAQNEEMFAEYIKGAYIGSLAKEEFIHSILRLEHVKLKETRAFLSSQIPFSEMDASQTEFYRRMLHTPEDFPAFIEYLHRIKRPEYDVFDMYSKFYDFITLTPQKRKEQIEEEKRKAAEEAQKDPESSVQGEEL